MDEIVKLVFADSWYRYASSPLFDAYVEEHVSLTASRTASSSIGWLLC